MSTSQGLVQWQPNKMPNLSVKDTCKFILKLQPKGQTSNLRHTYRLTEYSPKTKEAGKSHPGILPLPHPMSPVFPGKKLVHTSGGPVLRLLLRGHSD